MATYTRNNETISGSSGSMDYHTLTSAADSLTVTNITVVSGGSVPVPDYWEPYTVNGGVMIYDAKDGNDTMTGRNLKIEGGLFQFIGGDNNDKLSINGANVSGGSLKVNGAWDNDSLNVSNVTISGGNAYVHGDTGTDSVSVSKVSVTGGNFIQRDHGRSNVNTANEVTIQGGHFEVSTGILERVGDDPLDANSVVESIGGSNTISANKISMTGGSLAVYSEGADNSIKVSDVTMTGGVASIYGGKTANINGGKGTDTISVSKVSMGSYYASLSVFDGGSNNSISVEDVTISGGRVSVYGEGGNNTITANKLFTETYNYLDIHAQGKANSIAITNSTIAGYYGASVYGEGGNDTFSFTNNTVTGDDIKIWGGSSEDKFTVEDITISGGTVSINGKGGADNFTVDNVSMTGGNIYVIGGNGNANVSVSNIDKTAGYFDIDMGGHDSVTSGNDTIFVENISNAYRAYFDIYARDGADSISIKNSTNNGYLRAYGGAGNDSIFAENISVEGSYGYFSIDGGADDDLISLKAVTKSYAYGEDSNDTIIASESRVGIDAGAGNDSVSVTKIIENSAANFDCGEGNDTIEFYETWMPNYDSYTGTGGRVSGDAGNDLLIARNATINGTAFYGGEGNDTISVDNSTLTSGARFYNGAGNDSVSVSNITGNFSGDVIFGSGDSDYVGNGNDTISLDNWTLTGDDSQRFLINGSIFTTDNSSINGADSISIKNIIAPNATFYVYGKGGNDTVLFENMTLGGLGISYGDTMVRNGNIYGNFYSGNDSISVSNIEFYKGSSSNVSLNGGEGADTISVDGVTLGDENDGKYTQSHLTVTGGAGADVINVSNVTVTGSYSKGYILGEDGADKISVTDSSGLQITGGDGNDTIYFGGALNATLTDLASGDVVSLSGDYKKAYYKDGVLIYGTGVKVSLSGVDDVADISNITIYNGSTRTNFGSFVTVLEWKLEDGVASYGDLLTVSGLSANATFENLTVDGKAINTLDDEEIKASGKPVVISKNALDTSKVVEITDGYTLALAEDVKVGSTTDAGWIISNGTAIYNTYSQTEGYILSDNKITHVEEIESQTLVTVNGLKSSATSENLSIDTENHIVTIEKAATTKGKLSISEGYTLELAKGTYTGVSVVGGEDTDSIINNGNNVLISVGAGEDLISLASGVSKNTINGGAGDDSIFSTKGKNIYQYASGDGNDYFIGFSENDSLQITSGEIDSWKVENSDLIFNVGEGSITFKDGANKKINTAIGKGKAVANYYTTAGIYNDKKTAVTIRADVESAFTADSAVISINGALTEGVQIGGNSKSNYITGGEDSTLTGGAGNDTIYSGGSNVIYGDAGNDKIFGGDSADTIFGGAGNDTLNGGNGEDLFVYQGGNDVITDYAAGDKISLSSGKIDSVSVSGKDVTLKIGKGSIKIKNGLNKSITTNDETKIYDKGKIYDENKTSVTVTAAITETLASSVKMVDGSNSSGVLKLVANDLDNEIFGGKGADSILGNVGNDTINGNAGNDKLFGGDGNDEINGGAGNDSIFGGIGNDTLTGGAGNDTFYFEGGNDTITDYEIGKDKLQFTTAITNYEISSSDLILKTENGTMTVKDGAGKKITTITKIGSKTTTVNQIYVADGILNDKQTAITLNADVESYTIPTKPAIVSIDGAATNGIEITGGTKAEKIFGGIGADILNGGAGNDSIFGNDGNDSINGGAGNDTLTGGNGEDLFVYDGGNDFITDYAEDDKISIASGEISSVGISSKDVVMKVGSNTLKIKDALGKKINVNDEVYIYEKSKIYDENKTSVTVTSAITETLESSVKTVDGSNSSGVLKLVANDLDNEIFGGKGADSILGNVGNDTINGNAGNDKLFGGDGDDEINGGAGNDSLYGDGGNDTLTGGDGADVFIYESGNDLITDYAAKQDKIKFNVEITNTTVSSGNVIFETANGNLTVKDGAGVEITYIDSKNKTTKNTYSDLSAKTFDLLEDNNFVTDEFEIDDITEEKFEVQNIETPNYNLAQDENILTYGKDK